MVRSIQYIKEKTKMAISLKGRNFFALEDFTPEEIRYLLDLAIQLKKESKEHMEREEGGEWGARGQRGKRVGE